MSRISRRLGDCDARMSRCGPLMDRDSNFDKRRFPFELAFEVTISSEEEAEADAGAVADILLIRRGADEILGDRC